MTLSLRFSKSLRGRYTLIEKQISSSGCCIGARAMHQSCLRNAFKVSKENV